jgi:cytosine/adenosine deaminase-related metal-dependent hydrolase
MCRFYYGDAIDSIKKSGMRCVYTRCLMDNDGNGESRFNEFKDLYEREKNKNDLITFSMSFHSFYTCSMDYIKECKKYADKNNINC